MSMTNEQREAIKICEHYKNILYACNYEKGPERTGQAIETALSLIKEQQEKMENKDKQIDLMAELVYKRFKAELLLEYGFENEEQLKQYFAELVEKE